jgi:hypothetical protein
MKNLQQAQQDVYLSKEEFENDLEICLTILDYPNSKNKFYVCEYISASLNRKTIRIFIK